jgi:pimeloyl-ACP methyl ester carboxylesterase
MGPEARLRPGKRHWWPALSGCVLAALCGACDRGAPGAREADAATEGIDVPPARESVVTAASYRVLVRDFGPPDGPPLMLVHGYQRSGWSFAPLLKELAGRYRVVVPDLPGHGETFPEREGGPGAEPAPPFAAFAEVIGAVADRLGLRRFVLLGHSMGGVAAAGYARAHPDRVAALILLESTPTFGWPKAEACRPDCDAALGFERVIGETNALLHGKAVYSGLWAEYIRQDETPVLAMGALPILWIMNTEPGRDRDYFLKYAAGVDPAAPARITLVTADRRGHFLHWTEPALVSGAVTRFLAESLGQGW